MIIGICGGSGSGKTYLAERLRDATGAAYLAQDRYYRDLLDQPEALRAAGNFDHPDTIDFALLTAHVGALKAGVAVDAPLYDFTVHRRRAQTERLEASPTLIVEGTLLFAHADLLPLLDLKVFVDTEADLRLLRRIRRDVAERGRTLESVLGQWEATVRPMHRAFVEPGKRVADLIVPESADSAVVLGVFGRIDG